VADEALLYKVQFAAIGEDEKSVVRFTASSTAAGHEFKADAVKIKFNHKRNHEGTSK